jgi:imidazolonepropionase
VVSGARAGKTFAIVNATIATLEPCRHASPGAPVDNASLGILERAMLVAENGRVTAVGSRTECAGALAAARRNAGGALEEHDAEKGLVLPGLVDAHTHALFAGDRIEDFEALSSGRKPKLGIRYTVEQTRKCSAQELVSNGAARLHLMAAHGTTTAEVKSCYALTAEGEATLLRAMAEIDALPDTPHVVPTYCGAHALPPEFDSNDAFVDYLCEKVTPAIAQLGIARYADAFCDVGAFTPEQSRRFLERCAAFGMALRLHADELAHSGGSALAASLKTVTADHLNFIEPEEIAALAGAGAIAVLCPATTEFLGLSRYAPARALIAAGVPVALATDFNPGTSPCPSLQTVAHLARRRLQMTSAETIAAVTCIAARSLNLGASAGYLMPGATADVLVLETTDHREFGYYYGANLARSVFIGEV